MSARFNIVLHEPEIPQNTGSIGRLCVATQSRLHLIEPLGFDLSESRLKRAGLDYWEHLEYRVYKSWEHFEEEAGLDGAQVVFFTKKAGKTHFEFSFSPGAFLVFGKETAGLPDYILSKAGGSCVRIPMFDARVRSLNLANAVSIGVYEGIRQQSGDRSSELR